jgi:2-polyprenyl-6-methoxyphenol hydroxylase-like FAD-dependent oxidoreductase
MSVIIVGAGPTGLTTACTLLRHGVGCRVVDRRRGPGMEPKALILWSGALEVLRRLGVTDALKRQALPLRAASYWSGGRRIAAITTGTLPDTAFPGPLCAPQPVTEQVLFDELAELGGSVEWGVEAVSAKVHADVAEVTLRTGDGAEETATADWLVAADGIHSKVRDAVGIVYAGNTYPRTFLLGDGIVSGATPTAEAQYHMTPAGVLVMVTLPGGGHRVFFDIEPDGQVGPPELAQLQRLLDERGPGGLTIESLRWASRFEVHAKIADRFRLGRCFVAGDAAHCHSPAGGQGLNTGIQDGFDLGWKLAAVIDGADPALLDSYEAERRPASLRAIGSSDQQTRMWLMRSPVKRFVRDRAVGFLARRGILERRLLPQIAQIDPDLSQSPAVADLAGADAAPERLRLGRRVPEFPLVPRHGLTATSLQDYLATGHHTVLVGGPGGYQLAERLRPALPERVNVLALAAELPPEDACVDVALETGGGLKSDRAWLVYVRPDGIVAARSSSADFAELLNRVASKGSALSA